MQWINAMFKKNGFPYCQAKIVENMLESRHIHQLLVFVKWTLPGSSNIFLFAKWQAICSNNTFIILFFSINVVLIICSLFGNIIGQVENNTMLVSLIKFTNEILDYGLANNVQRKRTRTTNSKQRCRTLLVSNGKMFEQVMHGILNHSRHCKGRQKNS